MSEANVEQARRGYEAWNQGDVDWFVENMSADVEVRPAVGGLLELEEVYRGHDGFMEFWGHWRDAPEWSQMTVRVDRIEDLGDDEVLVFLTFGAIGRESGASVSLAVAHWLSIREGKFARLVGTTPEDAERRLADRRRSPST